MKLVFVSGVFALACAGLAMASIGPSDPVKVVTAAQVSATEADTALIDKKEADTGTLTQASAGCDADPALPICAGAADKN
ncbi:hypothetical protein [Roseicyclus mahoneyensis]|uniref:Uncharacterized protein n=1 Tax=Roseicyclus mahoneyensis TaxID=164332 RepID=A0A316GP54_9RHOB|nr:hypothetical protein [Roseicyclus mahoneyensis]PWK62664.1 hypothetical protein C7455_101694 [Roseicyclus mahoneyensis]